MFDRRLQAVEERAGAKLHEVSSTLEGLLARIEDALAQRGRALSETLARSTLETAKALGDGGREITQGMSAKSAEIGEALQRRAEELTQTLSAVARDINATLTGRVEDVSRSLGRERRPIQGARRHADAGPEPALQLEPSRAGRQGGRARPARHGDARLAQGVDRRCVRLPQGRCRRRHATERADL